MRYLILGAGRQGIAAAYDLAKFGKAQQITILDGVEARAKVGAERVNTLVKTNICQYGVFDADDVTGLLSGYDACINCTSYVFNVDMTRTAISEGCHFADLGGNTDVVRDQVGLHQDAVEAGVAVVPDCGVAPGMANVIAAFGMTKIIEPKSVEIFCGGLPQNHKLPLGYTQLFSIEGLRNEYTGNAIELRNGGIVEIPTLSSIRNINTPIGILEASETSGGTSMFPQKYRGSLKDYSYRTFRYPGHFAFMKQMKDFGFLEKTPVRVAYTGLTGNDHYVLPSDVFNAVMEKAWNRPEEKDLLVMTVRVEGENGQVFTAEVVDRFDTVTGFSAMERTTAFSAAIVMIEQAHERVRPGCHDITEAMNPGDFMGELGRRGIDVKWGIE
jgi:lysine 6-dehydrogenase